MTRAMMKPLPVSLLWSLLSMVVMRSVAAELEVNADRLVPQTLTINRGDSLNWVSSALRVSTVGSFAGEFRLKLESASDWSGKHRFDEVGTIAYRRYPSDYDPDVTRAGQRSGLVIVRDWTNAPPAVTINAPQDGDIFNFGPGQEPVSLMVTTTISADGIDRVELVSGESILAVFTNAPYFMEHRDLPLGPYRLVARVFEKGGEIHESSAVNIGIQEVNTTILKASRLRMRGRNLVMVSWLEKPGRGVMNRDLEITELGRSETSSTSFQGVRFWIEPADVGPRAFFKVRQRF